MRLSYIITQWCFYEPWTDWLSLLYLWSYWTKFDYAVASVSSLANGTHTHTHLKKSPIFCSAVSLTNFSCPPGPALCNLTNLQYLLCHSLFSLFMWSLAKHKRSICPHFLYFFSSMVGAYVGSFPNSSFNCLTNLQELLRVSLSLSLVSSSLVFFLIICQWFELRDPWQQYRCPRSTGLVQSRQPELFVRLISTLTHTYTQCFPNREGHCLLVECHRFSVMFWECQSSLIDDRGIFFEDCWAPHTYGVVWYTVCFFPNSVTISPGLPHWSCFSQTLNLLHACPLQLLTHPSWSA